MKHLKILLILFMTINIVACSTAKRSRIYGGTTGAIITGLAGGMVGKAFSPNKESERGNEILGVGVGIVTGIVVGALVGGMFYDADPDNRELKQMIIDDKKEEVEKVEIPDLAKTLRKNQKIYKTDQKVPAYLKNKVQEQYLIEHEVPEKVEYFQDGKSIIYEKHKAYEYGYSVKGS